MMSNVMTLLRRIKNTIANTKHTSLSGLTDPHQNLCSHDFNKRRFILRSKMVVEYFSKFERIDDYFRARKIERVKQLPPPLLGMSVEDDMFQDWETPPEDLDFEVVQMNNEIFDQMLEMTIRFPPMRPGKSLKLIVKETNSNKAVGFIKMGSPSSTLNPEMSILVAFPILAFLINVRSWGSTLFPFNHSVSIILGVN